MRTFVFDTSAFVRLYVPDGPLPDGAEAAIESAWNGDAVVLAPELALAEIAGVLRKKEAAGQLPTVAVDRALDDVLRLPVTFVGHADLVTEAMSYARSSCATVYDALFVALAIERGAVLISADDAQLKAWRDLA